MYFSQNYLRDVISLEWAPHDVFVNKYGITLRNTNNTLFVKKKVVE